MQNTNTENLESPKNDTSNFFAKLLGSPSQTPMLFSKSKLKNKIFKIPQSNEKITILNDKIEQLGSSIDKDLMLSEEDSYIHNKFQGLMKCNSRFIMNSMFLDAEASDSINNIPTACIGPEDSVQFDFRVDPKLGLNHIAICADAEVELFLLNNKKSMGSIIGGDGHVDPNVEEMPFPPDMCCKLSQDYSGDGNEGNDEIMEDIDIWITGEKKMSFYFNNALKHDDNIHKLNDYTKLDEEFYQFRVKFKEFKNIEQICFYKAERATIFKQSEEEFFEICNRPMNMNIFWNSLNDLTLYHFGQGKQNMFNNHVTVKQTQKKPLDENTSFITKDDTANLNDLIQNKDNEIELMVKKDFNSRDYELMSSLLKLNQIALPFYTLNSPVQINIFDQPPQFENDKLDIQLQFHRSQDFDKTKVLDQNIDLYQIIDHINADKDGKQAGKNIMIRAKSLKQPIQFKNKIIFNTVYFTILKMNNLTKPNPDKGKKGIKNDDIHDQTWVDPKYKTNSQFLMKMLFDRPNFLSIQNNDLILVESLDKSQLVQDKRFCKLNHGIDLHLIYSFQHFKNVLGDSWSIKSKFTDDDDEETCEKKMNEYLEKQSSIIEAKLKNHSILTIDLHKKGNWFLNISVAHLGLKQFQNQFKEIMIDSDQLNEQFESEDFRKSFNIVPTLKLQFNSLYDYSVNTTFFSMPTLVGSFYFTLIMNILSEKMNQLKLIFKQRDINMYTKDTKWDKLSAGNTFDKKNFEGYSKFYKQYYKWTKLDVLTEGRMQLDSQHYLLKFIKILPFDHFQKQILVLFSDDQLEVQKILADEEQTFILLQKSQLILKIPTFYHFSPLPMVLSCKNFIEYGVNKTLKQENPVKYYNELSNYINSQNNFNTFPLEQKNIFDIIFNFGSLTTQDIEDLESFKSSICEHSIIQNHEQLKLLHELLFKFSNYWDDQKYFKLVDYVSQGDPICANADYQDKQMSDPNDFVNKQLCDFVLDDKVDSFEEEDKQQFDKMNLDRISYLQDKYLKDDMEFINQESQDYQIQQKLPFFNKKFHPKQQDIFAKMADRQTQENENIKSMKNKNPQMKEISFDKMKKKKTMAEGGSEPEDFSTQFWNQITTSKKDNEMILNKDLQFKVLNTPIKPKTQLSKLQMHSDMDIQNEFTRDFIDWIQNNFLFQVWLLHLTSQIGFLFFQTINITIICREYTLDSNGVFVHDNQNLGLRILISFFLVCNFIYTIFDTMAYLMNLRTFVKFKDYNSKMQEVIEFLKIFKNSVALIRLILCQWSLGILLFGIQLNFFYIQIFFQSIFVSFQHISNFTLFQDDQNILQVTMTQILTSLTVSIIMSLVFMLGLIFGVQVLLLNALPTTTPLDLIYESAFETFQFSLMGDFGQIQGIQADAYPAQAEEFRTTIQVITVFVIVQQILLYLNMIIAIMGNVQGEVDEKRNQQLQRSKVLQMMQQDSLIRQFLFRSTELCITPQKIKEIDPSGNSDGEDNEKKTEDLTTQVNTLTAENELLRTQLKEMTSLVGRRSVKK